MLQHVYYLLKCAFCCIILSTVFIIFIVVWVKKWVKFIEINHCKSYENTDILTAKDIPIKPNPAPRMRSNHAGSFILPFIKEASLWLYSELQKILIIL